MGFYELRHINIPTVLWKEFTLDTTLAENMLWTIRVAVETGNDLNLPRVVGVNSQEAYQKGKEFLSKYKDIGLVIYYPYFMAEKSGVIAVHSNNIIIEAVDKDLWNLVTYGKKDVTIILTDNNTQYTGNEKFLSTKEVDLLKKYANVLKAKYRDIISEGKSIFAEWSFAYNTDINHKPMGDQYLIFYELRSVN